MGRKLKFNVLCSTRKACPDVKKALESLGFTNVKDVLNQPTADIEAVIEVKDQTHLNEILNKVSKIEQNKISQVTVSL